MCGLFVCVWSVMSVAVCVCCRWKKLSVSLEWSSVLVMVVTLIALSTSLICSVNTRLLTSLFSLHSLSTAVYTRYVQYTLTSSRLDVYLHHLFHAVLPVLFVQKSVKYVILFASLYVCKFVHVSSTSVAANTVSTVRDVDVGWHLHARHFSTVHSLCVYLSTAMS